MCKGTVNNKFINSSKRKLIYLQFQRIGKAVIMSDGKTILYHGSKVLVEYPEIRIAKYNKDFYYGFYCTMYQEQAERWAARFTGKGFISEFLYSPQDNLKVKHFTEMTEEWLDFRRGH